MYGCFSPTAMPRRLILLWSLFLPATWQGPQRMKWKGPDHTFLLSNSPLRCRLSKLQSACSFLYSCKQIIREKQLMHDYRQTWLRQHGSELNLIWKVGHSFCILFFFPFKAAVIIAWWRRKEKKRNKKNKSTKAKSWAPKISLQELVLLNQNPGTVLQLAQWTVTICLWKKMLITPNHNQIGNHFTLSTY